MDLGRLAEIHRQKPLEDALISVGEEEAFISSDTRSYKQNAEYVQPKLLESFRRIKRVIRIGLKITELNFDRVFGFVQG